ncbi:MAG: hypothetical protein HND48_15910 [Chloroflexi bacterium]|nr:hypothetical protein [Chloroflexota bacterium]
MSSQSTMPQALGEVAGPAKTVPEIAIRAMVSRTAVKTMTRTRLLTENRSRELRA